MKKSRSRLTVVGFALVWIAVPSRAAADPIPMDLALAVSSGRYIVRSGADSFSFAGPQIDLEQTVSVVTPKVSAATCSSCTPGDLVNLTFRHPPLTEEGFVNYVELGTGHGSIGGSTHPFISYSGSLKFNTGPIVFPDTDVPVVILHTPFAFRGWVQAGFEPGPFTGGVGFRLRGVGTASAQFVREGDAYRLTGPTTYEFQAVPEPSSILLLATGLAALCRAGYSRKRQG